ncbi:MAG: hypothetical protein ACLT76_08640 [Clostridium fessum]
MSECRRSTFKRPEGYFAGKLIEDAGLRGYQGGQRTSVGETLWFRYQP